MKKDENDTLTIIKKEKLGKDPIKVALSQQRFKERHPNYHSEWRKAHPTSVKNSQLKHAKNNPEKLKKACKVWRERHPDYNKNWFEMNTQYKDYPKLRRFMLKLEVLTHYANGVLACKFCGFKDIRALVLDHTNNNGAEHRASLSKTGKRISGTHMFSILKQQSYPDGFQVLCANCNTIKEVERREKDYIERRIKSENTTKS